MNNAWLALGAVRVRSTVLRRGRILITVCSSVMGVSYCSFQSSGQEHIRSIFSRSLGVQKGSVLLCPILV